MFWRDPVLVLAMGFGSGLAPKAPGTAGTAVGVVLYLLLAPLPLAAYLGTVAILFALGIPLCKAAAERLGRHDHPAIVWDEVVGFLVAMTALSPSPFWLVAGFVLFRLFDILKPWPIGALDRRVEGGLGIMLDDLLAGLFALACLQVMVYVGG